MDLRQAEHGHHRVADELLGVAAERAQLLARGVEESAEDLAGPLGVQPLCQAGRVDQVREQDRHHLALLGPQGRGHGGAAVRAEAGVLGERVAAELAFHGAQHRG